MIVYTRKAYPVDNDFNKFRDFHSLEQVLDFEARKRHFQLVGKHPKTGGEFVRVLTDEEAHNALHAYFMQ